MRLEHLTQVFGGRIRELGGRRWLDTQVSGLRTFIIPRTISGGAVTFDLAVFTPHTLELEPFFAREDGEEWLLDGARVVPTLRDGFIFQGCRRGILFASSTAEPSLDHIVSALWELAVWARKPWHPYDYEAWAVWLANERARIRRERLIRVGWVLLVVALILWLRRDAVPLLTLTALTTARSRTIAS